MDPSTSDSHDGPLHGSLEKNHTVLSGRPQLPELVRRHTFPSWSPFRPLLLVPCTPRLESQCSPTPSEGLSLLKSVHKL